MTRTESLRTVTTGPARRRARPLRVLASRDGLLVALLLVVLIAAALLQPRFASPITAGYLLLNAVPALLIALPMTLIIITGEIDLSVASIVGLSTTTIGSLTVAGVDYVPAVLAAIAVGLLAGAVNGALIAFVGLPSLAVTIGTLALYRGFTLVVIGDVSVSSSQYPEGFVGFVNSKLGATGIPVLILPVLLIVLVFAAILHITPFGRGLYALGYSAEAASFVGIRVPLSKFWLYVASGLTCSLVGVFWGVYYSARSDSASGLELTVIAAVLLGGVSIFGGRGSILGAVCGVLLIATVNYVLRLQRIPDVTLVIITGSLLILSVVAPAVTASLTRRMHVRRTHRSLPSADHA
ncbi:MULTISPECIES: ABC transporter permease [unclassified Rathayibacter]|uniref:ABC transporter permease n=1 Tax=unclassified Rathayibacter TaxID=2609250 RepID=UPI000F4C28C9|nr:MULTISPECIES: ABC transporter permease [unclassified Rathayibacter]ROP49081.1 monosaccharide ABC transporter membrane protein (CUT2 family) [Rathayibacter sp. PhB186]ROS50802.1 monosaccharide ABC transporter membrane protein (CUT2 family) [Rathayibacter sp. PhB185]